MSDVGPSELRGDPPRVSRAQHACYCLSDNQPEIGSRMSDTSDPDSGRAGPWCSAAVPPDATRSPVCGDALAQRESIDNLAIAGVTTLDPALEGYAAQLLHIPLPMPSIVDPVGGSISLTGMAKLAALAAPAGIGANAPFDPNAVGDPSEAALHAVERLDQEDAAG
jgi:hypothetical protein